MRKFKFALSTIWFYITMVVLCIVVSNVAFLTDEPLNGLPGKSFFFLTALTIFSIIIYFVSEHKRNKMGVDWILAPILLLLFGASMYAIWSTTNCVQFEYSDIVDGINCTRNAEIWFTTMDKIKYSIECAFTYLGIYIVSFMLYKSKSKPCKLSWLCLAVVLGMTVLCVISVFTDFAFFQGLLEGFSADTGISGLQGVFINENNFAYALLVGLLCALAYSYYHPTRWWIWFFVLLMFVFIIFTTSTTSIIVATLGTFLFLVVQIVFGFKNKHYKSCTLLSVMLMLAFFAIVILLFFGEQFEWKPVLSITAYLRKEIFEKDFTNFTGRTDVWAVSIQMVALSPLKALFGYGYGTCSYIFAGYYSIVRPHVDLYSTHSAYMQTLLEGGWVLLVAYVVALVYFVYCALRLMKAKQTRFALSFLVLFAVLVTHGFFESSRFFGSDGLSLITTILIYLPVVSAWKHIRKPILKERLKMIYVMPTQGANSFHFTSFIINVIISIIVGVSLSLTSPLINTNQDMVYIIIGAIGFLCVSILFVPYLLFLWYRKATDLRFTIRIILNSLWILGASLAYPALFIFKHGYVNNKCVIIGACAYVACLILCTIIYSCARKGSFVHWFKTTFKGIFVNHWLGKLIGIILAATLVLIVPKFIDLDLVSLIALLVMSILLYWSSYLLIPSRFKNEMLADLNEEAILTLKRIALREDL